MSNLIKNKLTLLMYYTASLINIYSIFESKHLVTGIIAIIMFIFTSIATVITFLNEEIAYETITKRRIN